MTFIPLSLSLLVYIRSAQDTICKIQQPGQTKQETLKSSTCRRFCFCPVNYTRICQNLTKFPKRLFLVLKYDCFSCCVQSFVWHYFSICSSSERKQILFIVATLKRVFYSSRNIAHRSFYCVRELLYIISRVSFVYIAIILTKVLPYGLFVLC